MKIICFYLPQFHQVPENDIWWGKGFTEWTHLDRAKNWFSDHRVRKPLLPQYDLLTTETRKNHGELARKYGIYGFCYHHYWFSGKLLLEKPLQQLLADGYPDLPFCFNWANENWTRCWDGKDRQILQKQGYGMRDEWVDHLNYLLPFFRNRNYIKVENRPLLLIYKLNDIPNSQSRIAFWQSEIKKYGFEGLHIVQVLNNYAATETISGSANAVCEFQPSYGGPADGRDDKIPVQNPINSLLRFLNPKNIWKSIHFRFFRSKRQSVTRIDYVKYCSQILKNEKRHLIHYGGGFPSFDNTPRRGKGGYVWENASPSAFRDFLIARLSKVHSEDEDLFFLNAWNEWGEGCVIEPELIDGFGNLEAVAVALAKSAELSGLDLGPTARSPDSSKS